MADVFERFGEQELAADLENSGVVDWLLGKQPAPAQDVVADTEGQARDPETGRFVGEDADEPQPEEPREEETPPQAEEEGDEDDEQSYVIELDEDLEQLLDKYDGDVGKALKALSESQRLIGRQGNELGEVRRELSQLKEMLEATAEQRANPPLNYQPYRNDIDDNPQGLVWEAMERGDGQTLHAALKAWGEIEPFEAAMFAVNLQQQLSQEAAQAQQGYQPSANPADVHPEVELEAAMAEVVQRHPDVEKFLPSLGGIAEEFPTLKGLLQDGNPAQKAGAFEDLVKIAKSRSGETSNAAIRRAVVKQSEEVAKEKADARVVSASRRSPKSEDTPKNAIEEFDEVFDQAASRYMNSGWIDFDPSWEKDRGSRPF